MPFPISLRMAVLAVACAQALAPSVTAGVEDGEARLVRIQEAIQRDDLAVARREIEEALRVLPGDARVYNFLGVVDAKGGDFEGAEAGFLRAVAIAPRFAGAYRNLGRLYQQRAAESPAALEKAFDVYRRLLEVSPADTEAIYQTASVLFRLKRFSESLQFLDRLPGTAQERAAALSLRCGSLSALDQRARAETCGNKLERAADLAEPDVLPLVPLLTEHHQEALAVRLLEALRKRNSASPASLSELAALYEKTGRLTDARAALTQALPVNGPPPVALLSQLAKLAYRSGDLTGALGYLAHVRDLEPGNASTHFLFGLVCIELKLPPEAAESFRSALRLDPKNPYYHYALGSVLLQQNDPDAAIPHFQQFQTARPDDPRGRFALAVAFFDAHRADDARRELQFCLGRPETKAGALLYLGRLALQDDNLLEAERFLQQSSAVNASSPDAAVELSLVQIRRAEYDLAAKTLARVLRDAPDNYRANLHLLLLYRRTRDGRAEDQARRVAELQKAGEEREKLLLRSLDIRPY